MTQFPEKYRPLAAHGFALIAVGIALILSLMLPTLFEKTPFLLFFGAVLFSAWVGGFGPGILASLLSIVVVNTFFLYPAQTEQAEVLDVTRLLVFVASVILITLVHRRLRQTMSSLHQSHDQLSLYLQDMANGVIVQDKSGKLIYANYEAAKMMGFVSVEALTGASINEILERFEILDEAGEPFPYGSLPARLALLGMRYPEAVLRYRFKSSGKDLWSYVKARPIFDERGEVEAAVSLFLDITELKDTQRALTVQSEQLRARVHQQEVIATLGMRALSEVDLTTFIQETAGQVAETLQIEYVKVLELLPGGEEVLLRAGVGWEAGLVGNTRLGTGKNSQAGYTLMSNEPVIVEDLGTETRFNSPALLREHNVVSGMGVIIPGDAGHWGVLSIHTVKKRIFTHDDIYFIQAIANLLASAISRERIERTERDQRIFAEALRDTAEALSSTLDLAQVLDCILENVERVLPHDAADIMLVEQDTARVARYRGYTEFDMKDMIAALEFPIDATPTLREMVQTSHALVIPDTHTYPGWLPIPKMEWLRSYIAIPLIVDGNVKGFLNLSSVTPNYFTVANAARLQPFASQATIAIRNAQLYSEARQRTG